MMPLFQVNPRHTTHTTSPQRHSCVITVHKQQPCCADCNYTGAASPPPNWLICALPAMLWCKSHGCTTCAAVQKPWVHYLQCCGARAMGALLATLRCKNHGCTTCHAVVQKPWVHCLPRRSTRAMGALPVTLKYKSHVCTTCHAALQKPWVQYLPAAVKEPALGAVLGARSSRSPMRPRLCALPFVQLPSGATRTHYLSYGVARTLDLPGATRVHSTLLLHASDLACGAVWILADL